MTAIYSLSLSSQITLDMHSLNNEGGEGNQIQTRMVNVVDANGELKNVNAISGDMIKHILADHLHKIALREGANLCASCQTLNANRISADAAFMGRIEKMSDADTLSAMLETCMVDDMLGNLLTAKGRSLPRKSVVEFGWVVGVPDQTRTDSYFHVKYANERSDEKRSEDGAEENRGANLGQSIFHRPANSGVYALVATIEASRIGFNDITQQYVLSVAERENRLKMLLEALMYTLVEPAGAMRGTQAPHILGVNGVVCVSKNVLPAPTHSALDSNFATHLADLSGAINKLHPDAIAVHNFDSLAAYSKVMVELIQGATQLELPVGASA